MTWRTTSSDDPSEGVQAVVKRHWNVAYHTCAAADERVATWQAGKPGDAGKPTLDDLVIQQHGALITLLSLPAPDLPAWCQSFRMAHDVALRHEDHEGMLASLRRDLDRLCPP